MEEPQWEQTGQAEEKELTLEDYIQCYELLKENLIEIKKSISGNIDQFLANSDEKPCEMEFIGPTDIALNFNTKNAFIRKSIFISLDGKFVPEVLDRQFDFEIKEVEKCLEFCRSLMTDPNFKTEIQETQLRFVKEIYEQEHRRDAEQLKLEELRRKIAEYQKTIPKAILQSPLLK